MIESASFQSQLARRASASGLDLPRTLGEQLEAYFRLLAHWNATINLTALPLDPISDEALDRLLIEPLSAARYLAPDMDSWFDLGSGGGSPAIPMKLAKTETALTMVESKYRKAAFLREAARSLGLTRTAVLTERIENVATNSIYAATADCVTVRAVRLDSTLLESVGSLLRPHGRALFFGAKFPYSQTLHGFRLSNELEHSSSHTDQLLVLDRVSA
jgi:16S rRNA (guanine527-N7)-methyltransferase